jgi:hypothetical protein
MSIVKGVRITDNRGSDHIVDGVLSEDGKFLVASVARSFVTQWNPSKNGSGNQVRAIGFGDIHLFRAENVQKIDEETSTADLDQIIGPLQIRVNEIDKGIKGKSISINCFLDDKYGTGDHAKPFSNLIQSVNLKKSILQSVAYAGERIGDQNYISRSSVLAGAAKAFADQAYKNDTARSPSTAVIAAPQEGTMGSVI